MHTPPSRRLISAISQSGSLEGNHYAPVTSGLSIVNQLRPSEIALYILWKPLLRTSIGVKKEKGQVNGRTFVKRMREVRKEKWDKNKIGASPRRELVRLPELFGRTCKQQKSRPQITPDFFPIIIAIIFIIITIIIIISIAIVIIIVTSYSSLCPLC